MHTEIHTVRACVCAWVCGSGQSFRWVQHGREFFVGVVGDHVVALRYAETASRSASCTHQVVYRSLNTAAASYDAARHAALGDRLRDYLNAQVDLLVREPCPAQPASWPSLAVCAFRRCLVRNIWVEGKPSNVVRRVCMRERGSAWA